MLSPCNTIPDTVKQTMASVVTLRHSRDGCATIVACCLHLRLMTMTHTLGHFIRGIVATLLTAHVFYMFALARTQLDGFGFDLSTVLLAALFALVVLLPFAWAVVLGDIPEVYITQIRSRNWYRANRCPQCGYDLTGIKSIKQCPECGGAIAEPPPYKLSRTNIRRFITINLAAWVLGCVVAEAWLGADEAAFVREAQAAVAQDDRELYQRPRRWPFESVTMVYHESEGAYTTKNVSNVGK